MTLRLLCATTLRAATLLAAAVSSTLALAADPPSLVGRIAVAEGQVRITGEVGDEANGAQVNWPVTSHNLVATARGARTEIRVGSTSVRLDGDSSLEVSELDDDSVRLRLNYGSVNVRVRSADVVRGFELVTPNGVVRLQEPGAVRIDSERVPGVTVVTALLGTALVNDRGGQLIVRAGKRLEVGEDVRSGAALRDGFDDWSYQRDQLEERSVSARYVSTDMTGYEDLDRHGVWREDAEYGALWLPTTVAADWAPYRDGSWTWIAPWGWTWVDNAPWGYAPFHYGRWVQVNQRWAWAPGRRAERPVWAPALVGWVGGSNWNLNFNNGGNRRPLPATGWYPLAPREAYVPGYRLPADHLQRINRDHDGRDGREGRDSRDGRDGRDMRPRQGLTVVPQAQFGQRGTVAVRNAPRIVTPPVSLPGGMGAAPAAPGGAFIERERMDSDAWARNRPHRPEMRNAPVPQPAPLVLPGQPAPSPLAPSQQWRRDERGERNERAPGQVQLPAAPAQPQPLMQQGPRDQQQRQQRDQFQRDQPQREQQQREQQQRQQQAQQQQQVQQQQQAQQQQQQQQQQQVQQQQQAQQQLQAQQQREQQQRDQQQRQQREQQQQQQQQDQQQRQQREQQQAQQQQQLQQQQRDQQQREGQRGGRDDRDGAGNRRGRDGEPGAMRPAPAPAPAPAAAAAPAAVPTAAADAQRKKIMAERHRGGEAPER